MKKIHKLKIITLVVLLISMCGIIGCAKEKQRSAANEKELINIILDAIKSGNTDELSCVMSDEISSKLGFKNEDIYSGLNKICKNVKDDCGKIKKIDYVVKESSYEADCAANIAKEFHIAAETWLEELIVLVVDGESGSSSYYVDIWAVKVDGKFYLMKLKKTDFYTSK